MTKEFKVPATGVLDYQRFVVDPGFKEDVWVQAAECRPGNRKVVHHILVYILAPGRREPYDPDGTAATLVGWAPGDMPAIYSPDTARLDSRRLEAALRGPLHAQRHRADRSLLGRDLLAKKPPANAVEMNILANMIFRIPPRAAEPQGPDDVHVPRRRPRAVVHAAHAPAGHQRPVRDDLSRTARPRRLLSVPDYDFGWQSVYRFEKPLQVPKGSKLTWIGHWDNSADNPRNPDPNKAVHWGLQTWDEMQNGWMEVVWKKPKSEPVSAQREKSGSLSSVPFSRDEVTDREVAGTIGKCRCGARRVVR